MKQKILIVEDDQVTRKIIEKSLSDRYLLFLCQNGKEAIDEVESFSPDLILLDIMLPDMTGYEVCQTIKSNSALAKVPIIFLSAKTGTDARSAGYELGAVNYLEKPFNLEELRAVVKSVLKNSISSDTQNIILGEIEIDLLGQTVKVGGAAVVFTSSEFIILSQMVKSPQNIFSRQILLDLVSPNKSDITFRTIDNHISSLRKKIKNTSIQIKTIYGEGYKLGHF